MNIQQQLITTSYDNPYIIFVCKQTHTWIQLHKPPKHIIMLLSNEGGGGGGLRVLLHDIN